MRVRHPALPLIAFLLLLGYGCGSGGEDAFPSDSDAGDATSSAEGLPCAQDEDCPSLDAVCEGRDRVEPAYACEAGRCVAFERSREHCPQGCAEGACLSETPSCDPEACDLEALAWCDGDIAMQPSAAVCEEDRCTGVDFEERDCSADNRECVRGKCRAVRCGAVVCDQPPDGTCSAEGVFDGYEPYGACVGETCVYRPAQQDCAALGEACTPRGCTEDCVNLSCEERPAPRCERGVALSVRDTGRCVEGECLFVWEEEDCTAAGAVCAGGSCIEDCAGERCDTPPAPLCSGHERIAFAVPGECVADTCIYEELIENCGDSGLECAAGECLPLCGGQPCAAPPESFCVEGTAHSFPTVGICRAERCSYFEVIEDCSAGGLSCESGVCVNACEGKVCESPPPPECVDAFHARRYPPSGVCVDGECSYEGGAIVERCRPGTMCVEGECRDEVTCEGAGDCLLPPPDCAGAIRRVYSGSTSCSGEGLCAFSHTRTETNCAAQGRICYEGACVPPLCRTSSCTNPPQGSCEGSVARAALPQGSCNGLACTYAALEDQDCEDTSAFCGGGVCHPHEACFGVDCSTAPEPYCEGSDAIEFLPDGACHSGECTFERLRTPCSEYGLYCHGGACVEGDRCVAQRCTAPDPQCDGSVRLSWEVAGCSEGACSLTSAHEDCALDGERCVDGTCVPLLDCTTAPCGGQEEVHCDGNTAVRRYASGTCRDGACEMYESRLPCGHLDALCLEGSCVPREDACALRECTAPAPRCVGDRALRWEGEPACDPDSGQCLDEEIRREENCAERGLRCDSGWCTSEPLAGDLAFTELLLSSSGLSGARLVEFRNVTERALALEDVVFVASGRDPIPLHGLPPLPPGEALVLASGALVDISDVPPGAGLQLSSTRGSLRIERGTVRVAELDYDVALGWPVESNRALQLDAGSLVDATERVQPYRWCAVASELPGFPGLRTTPRVMKQGCEGALACTVASCTDIPPDTCASPGKSRNAIADQGLCRPGGTCDYTSAFEERFCSLSQGEICQEGVCDTLSCTSAAQCVYGSAEWSCYNERFRFRVVGPGICEAGTCRIGDGSVEVESCGSPLGRCEEGVCILIPVPPEPGDLLVSEIFAPLDGTQFVELHNVSGRAIVMEGLVLENRRGERAMLEDLEPLAPNGRVVVALASFISADFAHVTLPSEAFRLQQDFERLEIWRGTRQLTVLEFGTVLGWPLGASHSAQLGESARQVAEMRDPLRWCRGETPVPSYPGVFGLPGSSRGPCLRALDCADVDCGDGATRTCVGPGLLRIGGGEVAYCQEGGTCLEVEGRVDVECRADGSARFCDPERPECRALPCTQASVDCAPVLGGQSYCEGEVAVFVGGDLACVDGLCVVTQEAQRVDCSDDGARCAPETGACVSKVPEPGDLLLTEFFTGDASGTPLQYLKFRNISNRELRLDGIRIRTGFLDHSLASGTLISAGEEFVITQAEHGLLPDARIMIPTPLLFEPLLDDIILEAEGADPVIVFTVGRLSEYPVAVAQASFLDPQVDRVADSRSPQRWCLATQVFDTTYGFAGHPTSTAPACSTSSDCADVTCTERPGSTCLRWDIVDPGPSPDVCEEGGDCAWRFSGEVAFCDVEDGELCIEDDCAAVPCMDAADCAFLEGRAFCGFDRDHVDRFGEGTCESGFCAWARSRTLCEEEPSDPLCVGGLCWDALSY